MADSPLRPLSRSVLAWALGRALRFAIGTCVVALLLATTLSGEAAERFATTAYLAAIFAALALALQRFLPRTGAEERSAASAAFPAFLSYSIGVVIFLSIVATLASQPGAEVLALVVAFALVLVAVLVRCGTIAALNVTLTRGGRIVAASRYAVVAVVGALALAALLGGDAAESIVRFAFRLTIVATLLIAASLLAPTNAGAWLQKSYAQTVERLDRFAPAFVFERTASYAAIVAVAAMIQASLLPPPFAEPFAITAYVAAAAAAFGVAMECRRLRS